MILPLTHERMTVRRLPWVTIAIIAANVVVFLLSWPRAREDHDRLVEVVDELHELAEEHPGILREDFEDRQALARYKELTARFETLSDQRLFARYGFVPVRQSWLGLLGSMFLHAGWLHLLGNMYLLWLCGCSLEDLWGRPLYLGFYLASGIAAGIAHAWAFPGSEAPLIGASGAIAGLMGAFLVRLFRARVRLFYWFWLVYGDFHAPAGVILPLWLGTQLFYAFVYGDESPVAFWAHVGGFVFGAFGAALLKLSLVEEAFLAPAIEKKTTHFAQHPRVDAALERIGEGRYREAVRDLQAALADNPDDVDALHLLADSYRELGETTEAARALLRKLRLHLRRRERDLAAATYEELADVDPTVELDPRTALQVASALAATDRTPLAENLYRRLVDGPVEAILKLKAALGLADLYWRERDGRRALEVLEAMGPLADGLPEWKHHLDEKLAAIRQSGAS